MIHMEAVQYIVRSYEPGASYLNKDPYRGVMTINVEGGRAYAFAMHGELTKADYNECLDMLRAKGIDKLYMNRNGTRQVINL